MVEYIEQIYQFTVGCSSRNGSFDRRPGAAGNHATGLRHPDNYVTPLNSIVFRDETRLWSLSAVDKCYNRLEAAAQESGGINAAELRAAKGHLCYRDQPI
jgi:hypothetical protein